MAKTGPKTELEKAKLELTQNEIKIILTQVNLEKAKGQVKLLTLSLKTHKEALELRWRAVEILEGVEARGEQAEDLAPVGEGA